MRILGHIHTFNDEDVIDRSLQALLDQTYPLVEIVIVDNASTDGTLNRPFPEKVTVIRHSANLGTNGSVITGFKYAFEHQYDWIWIFDADSAPSKDALEVLVNFYKSLAPEAQDRVSFLACLAIDTPTMEPSYGAVFTATKATRVRPQAPNAFCECHVTIWSGALYRLKAVEQIGMPSSDYVLDWGEFEYGYRARRAGFTGYMHEHSIMHHNIGGQPSLQMSVLRLGPLSITVYEFPPIRCYYMTRNSLYFWFYENSEAGWYIKLGAIYRVAKITAGFIIRPRHHGPQIVACLRGTWDAFFKRLHRRY
jgi:glycosyltransferase involved in cell wall biosynthesis